VFFGIAALGALLGLVYSGTSTADFVAHLDRQLHPVSCTLLPGLTEASQLDPSAEGCKVAMLSPFSSFWRDRYWGGVPYSLFAMGLFGFALALSIWAIASRRGHEAGPGLFALLAGVAAAGASVVFFWVSMSKLHTICTTCAGTYISSALLLVGGVLAFLGGRSDRHAAGDTAKGAGLLGQLAVLAVEMGVAVVLPVLVFLGTVPSYDKYVGSCESLKSQEDKANVLLSVGAVQGPTEAVFVLDPLCPACKAFHKRVNETRFAKSLSYKILLLPLDAECNWMLKDSMHPGACVLSKALLCAGDQAGSMLDFIYENQEEMRMAGVGKHVEQIRAKIVEKYANVRDCLDSPDTTIRLNKALHWAVKNSLPVLTPQLYLNGKRLCDEDTDLGLEYALTKLLGK
jgi:uncharacterized membrane protein